MITVPALSLLSTVASGYFISTTSSDTVTLSATTLLRAYFFSDAPITYALAPISADSEVSMNTMPVSSLITNPLLDTAYTMPSTAAYSFLPKSTSAIFFVSIAGSCFTLILISLLLSSLVEVRTMSAFLGDASIFSVNEYRISVLAPLPLVPFISIQSASVENFRSSPLTITGAL